MTGTTNTADSAQQEARKRPRVALGSNGIENSLPNAALPSSSSSKTTPTRNPYAKKSKTPPVRAVVAASHNNNDDDCLVVSPPPKRGTLNVQQQQQQQQQGDQEDTDDVMMLESNLINPNVDLPHGRPHCGVFSFANNKLQFCDNCYCVKCDISAKDCKSWALHCHEVQQKKSVKSAAPNQQEVIDIEDCLSPSTNADFLKARMAEAGLLDQDSSDDEWAAYSARPDVLGYNAGGGDFDHHYSNDFNHAYGNGSGNQKKGRSPKDMKITEVLAQKLMDSIQLSEGAGSVKDAQQDSSNNEKMTAAETFTSLDIQRKERYNQSRMEGDISQLGLQKGFFVEGVRVGWPYPAIMPPQRQMAIHLIKALKNKKHVVLESPTGTGKSAAILCAVLAWQRYHAKTVWGKTVKDLSAIKAAVSKGGSDLVQTLLLGGSEQEEFPRIIYCSRTHSQVEQMVASLKKTPYRPRMTVLGSRERLCIHKNIVNRNPSDDPNATRKKSNTNVNTACQLRVKNTEKARKALWKSLHHHYDDNNPPTDWKGDDNGGNDVNNSQNEDENDEDADADEGKRRTKKSTCPHYRQLAAARTAEMTRSNFIVSQESIGCCTSGGEKTKLGVHDIEDLVSFGLNPYKETNIALYRENGEGSFGFDIGKSDCRIKKIDDGGAAKSSNLIKLGDRIVAVNGKKVQTVSQACDQIRKSKDPLELTVLRRSPLSSSIQEGPLKTEEINVSLDHPHQKGFGMQLAVMPDSGGCTVHLVKPGGAAERSGRVRVGDKIVTVNGKDFENACQEDIVEEIMTTQADPLQIRLRHLPSGEEEVVALYRPKQSLGIELAENNAESCFVSSIAEGSLADESGEFQLGDRIIGVNGQDTRSWKPYRIFFEISNNEADRLAIRIRRSTRTVIDAMESDHEEDDEVDVYSPHAACPYYLSRALTKTAELIFAPYNYVLDPGIRSALDISLEGAVVVLDEAHNVEGTLTESGSGKFGEIELSTLISTLTFYASSLKSAQNKVEIGKEEKDLAEVAHQLLIFVEKVVLHMRKLKADFEKSPGNIGAAKAIEDYRKFKTPDDTEFEVMYTGPSGHGVHRQAVGCLPFFDKLDMSEKEMTELLACSSAMEKHFTGSGGGDDEAEHGNASGENRNSQFELLNGMISKFALARKNSEHFYISCVVQANGNFDFAAGVPEEEGLRRFKKKPKNLSYTYPRTERNPNALLPVCGHKCCQQQGPATLGYGQGTRHGEWCDGSAPQWESHIVLRLLFPGLLMKDLAKQCRSVVLASGSLSPLPSLCAELDLQGIETSKTGRLQTKPPPLEANHVVSLPKQLLAVAVGNFPDGSQLTCTYNHYKNPAFFPRLGGAIATVIEKIPRGGVLIFFPSYSFLKKCINCWNPFQDRRNGWRSFHDDNDNSCPEIWERFLNSKGKVIVEPTGSQEKFEAARDEYKDTIEATGNCILLAVFRGKMSEGISFNDDNARGVICVGIPFPGARDRGILAKKAYNDEQRKLKNRTNLLPGQDWYAQEAFRAIAQALGRCIRHAGDYGTVVLMDSRHCNDGSPNFSHSKLPKWMRGEVRTLSMTHRGPGHNPIVGGYNGLSNEMKAFFTQAPSHAQSVMDKMKHDLAKAREQEKQSTGHQFNSKTGGWTPTTDRSQSTASSAVTQDSGGTEKAPPSTTPISIQSSSRGGV